MFQGFLHALRPKELPLSRHERRLGPGHRVVEEGLFESLVAQLGDLPPFCVEFGAGDGNNFSLTAHRISRGWSAFLIEADPELFAGLEQKYSAHPQVKISQSFVSAENIQQLFHEHSVPAKIGLLCIDIDGMDYHVWQAIDKFQAAVICIEYNAGFGPHRNFVVPYDPQFCWQRDDYFGASFRSLVELGKRKGYTLVHCTNDGDNLIFVHDSQVPKLSFEPLPSEKLFQWPQYGRNGRSPSGKGYPVSPKNSHFLERSRAKIRYRLLGPLRALLRSRS
jgi:hypothetical protein